jgi:hypothetical protein
MRGYPTSINDEVIESSGQNFATAAACVEGPCPSAPAPTFFPHPVMTFCLLTNVGYRYILVA